MLSRAEVEHVAQLARLALSDQELDLLTSQLSGLLEHIEVLQTVDTSQVSPTAQTIAQLDVTRDDVPRPSYPPGELLANAPSREGDFFKVPAVLDAEH